MTMFYNDARFKQDRNKLTRMVWMDELLTDEDIALSDESIIGKRTPSLWHIFCDKLETICPVRILIQGDYKKDAQMLEQALQCEKILKGRYRVFRNLIAVETEEEAARLYFLLFKGDNSIKIKRVDD